MTKTNAMRLLDIAKINYKFTEYVYDDNNLSGMVIADELGANPDQIFKTLVTMGDKNGVNVFCIPVNGELDLKKAAKISKNKKIDMVHMKDLLNLTGYIRGGCSPIGMKKLFPTYIDETAILFDEIGISGGVKGMELLLNGEELCDYVHGELCDLLK